VVIAEPFWLGKYPITQAQWHAVTGRNPSTFTGDSRRPVENVSWDDCREYCRLLTELAGCEVRLPSEAEWEYSCRANSTAAYFYGDGDRPLVQYAWFYLNSFRTTHPVGLKRANPWGIHDLVGNVWEWCRDVWHSDYLGAPGDGSPWLDGEDRQRHRVLRGGSWNYEASCCRSCYRSRDWKDFSTDHFGLRVATTM
jgi:formylglycine-generating enzyme required for sulfatase activity